MSQIANTVATPAGDTAARSLDAIRYWTVVATHVVIDIYPIIFSALMHVLRTDLGLTTKQVLTVYALTPLFSGPPQILFAWLGDRFDTRVFGPLGLLVGGVCISLIGYAQSFEQLIVLEVIGVMGIGAYHPIAFSLAGQLGGRAIRHGRALAVSIFFTAGMLGHSLGPYISSRMNRSFGMESLAYLIIPAVIATVALVLLTKNVPHRDHDHKSAHAQFSQKEKGLRWFAVGLLAVQNALRFTSNVSLIVIANLWAGSIVLDDPDRAAILGSNIMIWLTVGMGISSLVAGRLIRSGREKWPIVTVTLLGSLVIASTGFVGRELGGWAIYAASCLGAIGFASVIPTCIAMAQRLLPSHTGLVSSLVTGLGWGISAFSTWLVPNVFVRAELENVADVPASQIDMGYVWIAGLVFVAGLLCMAIPSKLLETSARQAGIEGEPEPVENLSVDPEP